MQPAHEADAVKEDLRFNRMRAVSDQEVGCHKRQQIGALSPIGGGEHALLYQLIIPH